VTRRTCVARRTCAVWRTWVAARCRRRATPRRVGCPVDPFGSMTLERLRGNGQAPPEPRATGTGTLPVGGGSGKTRHGRESESKVVWNELRYGEERGQPIAQANLLRRERGESFTDRRDFPPRWRGKLYSSWQVLTFRGSRPPSWWWPNFTNRKVLPINDGKRSGRRQVVQLIEGRRRSPGCQHHLGI